MPTRFVLALAAALGTIACAGPPKEIPEVPSAEELYQQGLEILEGRRVLFVFRRVNYQAAIDAFQEVIDNYPYSEFSVLAELKIADAYFADGRYDEALSYYQDFSELHPTHPQVPYTLLRSALCYYERVRTPNRDQGPTRNALEKLDELLSRYPYSSYAREAEVLWRELRTLLARNVGLIGDFYMRRQEYQSAADRYRQILNEFPGLGLDAEALYKLGVCYSRMNLDDEAQRIFQVILENYEGTDVADAAADLIPAAN